MFRELWFADIVNYLVTNQTLSHWSKNDIYQFLSQVRYFFREEPYLFKYCSDKLLGDAFPMKWLRVFYPFVTNLNAVDTLVPARLLKKCYKVGSVSPLCSKMLMNFARRALDARWWEGSQNEI